MSKDRDFLRAFSGEDRMTAAQVADKLEQCAHQNRLTHTMFLTPLPPENRRHTARRAVRLCRNRRLRRRNRLRRFALRAVPPHQTLQRRLPCPKTEIFSEHFPAKTA